MNIIDTDRLILRKFSVEDARFVLELVNTPGWLRFIGDRGLREIKDAEHYILERILSCYEIFGFGMYLVELKDRSIPIGMCGLIKREILEHVDIGFAFLPAHVGKGYALEAASATISYAKDILGLIKLVAITNTDNLSSVKLLKKLGMNFQKMIKLPAEKEEIMLFGN